MVCRRCIEKPVIRITNSENSLCKSCFFKYFENKAKNTIAKYELIKKNDIIAVAVSGGKDSTTLLILLKKVLKDRRDVKLTALAIDEGIHGYRDNSLEYIKKICKEFNIDINIYSYKEEFGKSLDEILKTYKGVPCSICGVLRRYLLNKKAKEIGATKLATGHNMDDEVQAILMNNFRNNLKISARLGPITGVISDKRFIKRIKPLYFLTEKEVTAYAYLKKFMDKFSECPHNSDSYRGHVRDLINDFEAKYEGTKQGIINSFLKISPLLKEHYKSNDKHGIKSCEVCDEPCSGKICKACLFVEEEIKN